MKKMSIKLRVTLWYTLFMTVLAVIVLWAMLGLSSSRVLSTAQNSLKNVVTESFREIEWDREEQKLDIDDDLKYFRDGVYLAIYDSSGYLVYGTVPGEFPDGILLSPDTADQVQTVQKSGKPAFYIYDSRGQVEDYGTVWVRGMVSKSETESTFLMIVRIACILLPLMILCIAAGGYYITKRAFSPIRLITETAADINKGNDLSKRIRLGEGNDEVYHLAATFDRMLQRLEEQFEKEKRFTSDVSHELRTPVSVIISQCEYAIENNSNAEQASEEIPVILRQAKKMAKIISQLLTLSRADSGKERLQTEVVNVSELIEMILMEQQEAAEQKKIELIAAFQPDVLLSADETMLMRFFINLIQNAIWYGKEGGYVKVILQAEKDKVIGCIEDDGPGIPLDEVERIWDRFYQVETSRTAEKESGAGLGLPMVRWIAAAHGGSVRVESEPGMGCRFCFEFPRTDIKIKNSI